MNYKRDWYWVISLNGIFFDREKESSPLSHGRIKTQIENNRRKHSFIASYTINLFNEEK